MLVYLIFIAVMPVVIFELDHVFTLSLSLSLACFNFKIIGFYNVDEINDEETHF